MLFQCYFTEWSIHIWTCPRENLPYGILLTVMLFTCTAIIYNVCKNDTFTIFWKWNTIVYVKFLLFKALFHKLVIFQLSNTKFCANQKMCKFSTREVFPWARLYTIGTPRLFTYSVCKHSKSSECAYICFCAHVCCSEVQGINVTSQSGQNRCYVWAYVLFRGGG